MADTIFALSSGAPPCAIAVIRIAGPGAGAALQSLAGELPAPRRVALGILRDGGGDVLDQALVLWLPGPATELGEDMAELHLHGSRAVIDAVGSTLAALPGVRPATAGEFTRRAFANGKLDLAQVEGLGDLLAAETDAQRRNAIAVAGGWLSRQVEGWRERVLGLAAEAEAILDHDDEADTPAAIDRASLDALIGDLRQALAAPAAERLKDGVRVVIAGPPNAGKSTLLNRLVGREAAIVSPAAGTTRDVVEVPVSIEGVPFLFADTAGLRVSDDLVEREGVRRAETRMAAADVVLWLGEADATPAGAVGIFARADQRNGEPAPSGFLRVSATTGAGVPELVALLLDRAAGLLPRAGEVALNRRQREHLTLCLSGLELARDEYDVLLAAEALRQARGALDALLGNCGIEDVLDTLFGRFCIGK